MTDTARNLLHNYCHAHHPIILGIIEPKTNFLHIPASFWKSINLTPFHQNDRTPHASNIWILIATGVTCSLIMSTEQMVIVDILFSSYSFRVAIVHGSCNYITRRILWDDISSCMVPQMVILGDFNAVLGAHERRGRRLPSRISSRDFQAFIDRHTLIQAPTSGPFFTWTDRRKFPMTTESVLDRTLFSEDFAAQWHSSESRVLPRLGSDHAPILLKCSTPPNSSGTRPFRFLNMWSSHSDFIPMVQRSWAPVVDSNCLMVRMMHKLKRLRKELKIWNKSTFGNFNTSLEELYNKLSSLQTHIDNAGYSEELFDQEVELEASISVMLSRKDDLLRQKSRIRWLQDGDRNTQFYHNMVRMKRASHTIKHLEINDVLVDNNNTLVSHVENFYKSLFAADSNLGGDLSWISNYITSSLTVDQNSALVTCPTTTEIKAVVFAMDKDSAPGPDGFGGSFYRSAWDIIEHDFCSAIRRFFTHHYLPSGLNSNTLSLLPKKVDAKVISDYRPIVLGNFFYKVISKILAIRLNAAAATIVSNNQFGFILGRSIHECITLASEGANCMERSLHGKNMALKVDIHKAFDTLRWDFLLFVLQEFGFSNIFCSWIKTILSSARISIRFNGALYGYFDCGRGVRQGDPLSPILFALAEDVLSRIFLDAANRGLITGMRFSRYLSFPSHLLYADDVLLFCQASKRNCIMIDSILQLYATVSGQYCNKHKSTLYFGKGVSPGRRSRLQRVLDFNIGSMPFTYLGVPIFSGRPSSAKLRPIYDRILAHFPRWQGGQLSMAGRLCLVSSVINSAAVHSMLVYKWPAKLLHALDRACKAFIWTGSTLKKPSFSVSWNRARALKEHGGIGVKSFSDINNSFMFRLGWYIMNMNSFGYRLLRQKYLTQTMDWPSKWASSSIWTGVRRTIREIASNTFCTIGTGDTIYFWRDNWLGYRLIDKIQIPEFMTPYFSQKISDYYFDNKWHLTSSFMQSFPRISLDIISTPIPRLADDRSWIHSGFGNITAASAFAHIRPQFPKVDWGSWIWAPFIPARRSLFVWRTIVGKLPTFDMNRLFGIQGPNRCTLCSAAEETMDHVLLNCPFSASIWADVFRWFLIEKPLPLDVGSMIRFSIHQNNSKQVGNLWKAGVVSLLWSLWSHRNNVIHKNLAPSRHLILKQVRVFLGEAANNFVLGTMANSVSDLLILKNISIAGQPRKPLSYIYVAWHLPPPSWIKVNTDGSVREGRIHAGGVFRNAFNDVLGCYHFSGGQGVAFEAELLAIIIAIESVHRAKWERVWFESDSSYVVQLLQSHSETRNLGIKKTGGSDEDGPSTSRGAALKASARETKKQTKEPAKFRPEDFFRDHSGSGEGSIVEADELDQLMTDHCQLRKMFKDILKQNQKMEKEINDERAKNHTVIYFSDETCLDQLIMENSRLEEKPRIQEGDTDGIAKTAEKAKR
ncbi:uncharacterized protein LOC131007957 [Salvia miltiorrhiza]|uniref:uncharacterized protein LOC131007957 n=1 Tax=Salvia miltiorrhiza TaxID=226208 RepID=UPI0025ACEFED|nr:uncharacterized protein LOC131007957 [Salvia miltiorrhiza]